MSGSEFPDQPSGSDIATVTEGPKLPSPGPYHGAQPLKSAVPSLSSSSPAAAFSDEPYDNPKVIALLYDEIERLRSENSLLWTFIGELGSQLQINLVRIDDLNEGRHACFLSRTSDLSPPPASPLHRRRSNPHRSGTARNHRPKRDPEGELEVLGNVVSNGHGPEDGPAVTRSAQQVAANKTDPTYSGSSNGSRVTNLELTHPYDHTPPLPPCRSLTPETSPTHLADDNILAGAHNADDDPCLEIIHDSEHKPNGEIVQGEMTSLTLQTASSYLREPSPTQGETSMTIPDPLNLTISASESSLSNAGPPTDTLLSPLSSGLPQSHHMYLPVLQTAFTVISTHNDDIPQHESLYPDPGAAVSGPPSEYPKTTFSSSLQWRPLRGGLRSVDPASRENFPSDSLLAVASGDIVPLLRASSSSTGRESQRLWPERSDITPCNRVDALSEDDMLASTDSGYASPTKHRLAAVKSTRRSSYKRSIHRSMPLPDYDAPPSTALMPYSM